MALMAQTIKIFSYGRSEIIEAHRGFSRGVILHRVCEELAKSR